MTPTPAGRRGGRGRGDTQSLPATPDHLVPAQLERELVSGIFRAAAILEEDPSHDAALAALQVARTLDATDLAIPEHRDVVAAAQWVLREDGAISAALVRDELCRRRQTRAMRLLEDALFGVAYGYAIAPVASITVHVRKVREAARLRREYVEARGRAADIYGGAS